MYSDRWVGGFRWLPAWQPALSFAQIQWMWLLRVLQDVIEIMREGMFDRVPLSGLAGGVPVLDFRKAPGSRGGKAGEAARFIAALRAMASQHNRDVFSTAELQVSAAEMSASASQGIALLVARALGVAC